MSELIIQRRSFAATVNSILFTLYGINGRLMGAQETAYNEVHVCSCNAKHRGSVTHSLEVCMGMGIMGIPMGMGVVLGY